LVVSNLEEKWPVLGRHERAAEWLEIWSNLGRAPRTIDAYARGLAEYLLVCERDGVDPLTANRSHRAVRAGAGDSPQPARHQRCTADALERAVRRPSEHMIAIRSFSTMLILVKQEAFSGQEIELVRSFLRERRFDRSGSPLSSTPQPVTDVAARHQGHQEKRHKLTEARWSSRPTLTAGSAWLFPGMEHLDRDSIAREEGRPKNPPAPGPGRRTAVREPTTNPLVHAKE
jgi:hypothetical protein